MGSTNVFPYRLLEAILLAVPKDDVLTVPLVTAQDVYRIAR